MSRLSQHNASWFNAGPPSAMSGQQWSNTGKLIQWWATVCNDRQTLIHHRQVYSMVGHCLQCPANIDPTQASWFNAGRPSAISGQHWSNTGKFIQWWATVCNVRQTFIQHRQVASMLGYHLQCPANSDPTKASWFWILFDEHETLNYAGLMLAHGL